MDVVDQRDTVARAVERLKAAGITVSLFLDPDGDQIDAASQIGADAVELHTGQYSLRKDAAQTRATPFKVEQQTYHDAISAGFSDRTRHV